MNDDLLAAIGAARGLSGPYPLPLLEDGFDGETGVLGGVIDRDGGRVAWVEQVVGEKRDDGFIPVEISVVVAQPDGGISRTELQTYNPFFGARVETIRFYGDELVLVYKEKHDTIVAALSPPYISQRLFEIADTHVLVDDVYWHREYKGAVRGLVLPELLPCLPLPVPTAEFARLRADGATLEWAQESRLKPEIRAGEGLVRRLRLPEPEQRGYPADAAAVWDRMRELLADAGVPADAMDVLIGALTVPFWHAPPAADTYGGTGWATKPGPEWFPVAWHRYLRDTDAPRAERLLAALDLLAGDGETAPAGWEPGWSRTEGAARFAIQHLRYEAAAIARTCRSGRRPPSVNYAWYKGEWRHPLPLRAFPPGFVRAWKALPRRFRP